MSLTRLTQRTAKWCCRWHHSHTSLVTSERQVKTSEDKWSVWVVVSTTSEDKWNDKWRQVKRQVKTSETTSEDKWNDKWSWHNSHVSQRQVKLVFTCRWHDEVDTTHTWVNDKWSWHNSHVSCVSCVNVVSFTMLWMLWGLHRMDIHNSHCCDWHIFRCVENRSQNNSHCCEWHNECCVTHELRVCCVTHTWVASLLCHTWVASFFFWMTQHSQRVVSLCVVWVVWRTNTTWLCVRCVSCSHTAKWCVSFTQLAQLTVTQHSHNSHTSQCETQLTVTQHSYMNESCHSHGWLNSFICVTCLIRANEACHTYEWGMSHIWTN